MDTTTRLLSNTEKLLYVTDRDPVVMVRGAGMYLWDASGKRYLDFLGGWAVDCLGHSPKVLHRALHRQSRTLVNASPSFYNRPMLELAGLITHLSGLDRVFFCSTGAEANESAIKLARKYGALNKSGAYEIISTSHGFHGRTLATMAATGKESWRTLFEPKPAGFLHVPFNDVDAMKKAVTPNTVAVIVEPIQGEGGVNEATPQYLNDLRRLCTENQILLILDEIQTGIGRTGSMFAAEQYKVKPDIMTLGKGLGSGFPVAAMLCTEELNIFEPGDQGGTYTGQPLAMTAALSVVTNVLKAGLPANALRMGEQITSVLRRLSSVFPLTDIRGQGLLLAFDTLTDTAQALKAECFRRGLIVNAPGPRTVRLVPPLIVRPKHIQEMEEVLSGALSAVFGGSHPENVQV